MKVAYFSNQFASASGHGIAHYARRLYEGLAAFSDLEIMPVATWSDRSPTAVQALQDKTGLQLLPWGRKLTPLAWISLNAPPIERWLKSAVDITHMVALGMPVATRKRLVATIHDIGPLTHPEYFHSQKPWLVKRSFEHVVRYADAIVCVSQATADEVVGYAGESVSKRVRVVREGVDADFFSQVPSSHCETIERLPFKGAPFFLAAGAISPRKNIQRILEGFKQVKNNIPHQLVLVGGQGWDTSEVSKVLADPSLSARVHQLGYVSDEELQALYKQADFYIHPSLFEGFGLTVLEAMAASCPVITSNVSSLPEVAGKAALLVDPLSVDDIAEAIESLALSASLKSDLIARGLSRAQLFSWQQTAQGVADVYREISL